MFHIILVSPEMPGNVGNIIRLAANTGCQLHIILPTPFSFDDKRMIRAGLDYHEFVNMQKHLTLEDAFACCEALSKEQGITTTGNKYAISTKGTQHIGQAAFKAGDIFIFGRESAGLTTEEWEIIGRENAIRLPMRPESRSLNLSNAVAVCMYEAWRQVDFEGGV
ncbi:MAG: tRNA (cytidine(34)-2'-O)-methyltransferase [Alcaligenaceae bacterium]|nr:tRNA (cytidine(34)-2'-O)-methyltransferase [Alcaligenaceae bacterium]